MWWTLVAGPCVFQIEPHLRSSSWDQIGNEGWFSPQIYTSKLSSILWVILVLDGRSFCWGHRGKSWCCSNVQGKSYGCNFWRQAISFCLIVLLFFSWLYLLIMPLLCIPGDLEVAVEHLTEAIMLNPCSAILYATRGEVCVMIKFI